MSSDAMEFGLEESKLIKTNAVEFFKQTRAKEISRVSFIAFKKYEDGILAQKTGEKGSALSDEEKLEILTKMNGKLAEKLGKDVKDLTEVDRLNISAPRFAFNFTHYKDGVGTIKCLSKYEGGVLVKPEVCCDKIGQAEQTIGTVLMQYPLTSDGDIDEDMLRARKYTNIFLYKMSANKFKKVLQTYKDCAKDQRLVIDLKLVLDGDPKFQKQEISSGSNATWARDQAVDPLLKHWVLDQGLRAWKHLGKNLGFDMKRDVLLEKLGMGGGGSSGGALSEGSGEAPKLVSGYGDLI